MEAQVEVVAQLESLAFEPPTAGMPSGEEPAASVEEAPDEKPAASVEEAPDEKPAASVEEAPGEVAAASTEVELAAEPAASTEVEPAEEPAASTGVEPAEEPLNPPSPRQGSGKDQATAPSAEGANCSSLPAGHAGPRAAVSSSDSDSDTDSDTSSTTSFSSSSSSAISDEDDCPNGKDNRSYCVKTKDELPVDDLPPVEDLSIILPDNVELKPFGTVSSIIEQLVIIESLNGLPPVNEDSIIFKRDRQAAGKIFEIFGPVLHPFYVLRFNSSEHIKAKGINVQDGMYFAPSVEDFTQYIFAEKLKQEKGSDASWKNDEEPPPEALDFSDDEKEREAKQKKKPQSQGRKKPKWERNASSENNGINQSMPQPASSYSRGYCGRGFFRDSGPRQSGPPGFLRPQVRPPQQYPSDNRLYRESPAFPQHQTENPVMHQYPFPPPVFGSVNNMQQFHLPPSNSNMMWTVPNTYNSYSFLPHPPPAPPPPPPPPSTPSPNSHSFQFRPY
ncbi:H/ACA ribonucleoprotein complex non-core subunit NAF1 [Dryobates pubescens]|uniref:H/ACA ribonucleoprotein complex non-core subunit NAF1 n=1 Tax=Dryobates pubescens TaxID=118200 RepID=UPI0023B91E62|nr:H/ACA ribonucleoprotein complex non-core subunit NAF1 [Dryobates pubescens]